MGVARHILENRTVCSFDISLFRFKICIYCSRKSVSWYVDFITL